MTEPVHPTPASDPEPEPARHTFIAFTGGSRRLAVPFAAVRRVARLETFSPLPAAVPLLPGATNVQGHVVAVLDVAPLLGEPPTPPQPGMYLVIVQAGELEAGLLTPHTPTLHEVPEDRLQWERDTPLIEATYGWPPEAPEQLVEVLAVPEVLQRAQEAYA